MDYVVNKTEQIAVTAESPEEALKKIMAGEGTPIAINYGANPRPQQQPMMLTPAQMLHLQATASKKS